MNKEERDKEFLRLADLAAKVPTGILAVPSKFLMEDLEKEKEPILCPDCGDACSTCELIVCIEAEQRCDICGGDTREDEFGQVYYPHKIGCPEDPNHPPWL
jgi:uncharacterized paraquat-inducible protein A